MAKYHNNLPSINDFANSDDDLPSVEQFIPEESLPSVEDYIEEDEIKEDIQTIEDVNGESFVEVKDIVPPWPELIRLINDVREEIPDIPEIKYYDAELEKLCEIVDQVRLEIPEIQEVRYYDSEIKAICEQIDDVKEHISNSISELPKVKYYDDQIELIEEKLNLINQNIDELPEPKYYDEDLQSLKEDIEKVRNEIPTFPKWVNEVNEVPDFSWIGKTFSVIDDDFIKVNDTIETLGERVKLEIQRLSEENETRYFESKVQFGTEVNDLDKKVKQEKDKIWKELRESSLKIWEYHKEFKDDDKKLKKQILGEYNKLKQGIQNEIKKINEDNIKTDELLLKYFSDLKKEISNIQEKTIGEEKLDQIKVDIKKIYELIHKIEKNQNQLKEYQKVLPEEIQKESAFFADPPNTENGDPLTPINQSFVTLEQFQKHYKLFVERIQYQLSTIGGGGEVRLEFLDDVDRSSIKTDGYIIKYDSASGKFVGESPSGISLSYSHQKIISNGSTTETLNVSGRNENNIIVFVNGVSFLPIEDYTVNGTSLIFTSAPNQNSIISIRYLPI